MTPTVELRGYQKDVLRAFDNGVHRVVLCWSRRAGKSLFSWNLLIREAVTHPGVYWYCFNNYNTAYNDIWIAMTSKGVKFLDMVPREMVARQNSAKMEIELTNGSVIKLVGVDNADKLVGAGLSGVVFDEYAMLNPASVNPITAMLAETGGWRVYISTPRGKNHFFTEYTFAKAHPEFAYTSRVHCGMPEVAQHMADGFLEQERLNIIAQYGNDALYRQEYLTSWVSPNSGSVFGDLVKIMQDEGRITPISVDTHTPCYAAWDLGSADNTAIVLFQVDKYGAPAVVDAIENRNQDVAWYVGEIEERGWCVHTHFLPHDAGYRKGARNETYQQVLRVNHNIRNTQVLNKPHRVEDKLNFLRRVFSRMTISDTLTRVVECLEKLEYEWNERTHTWSDKPTHKGGYSDMVDALCYMAQAISKYGITSTVTFSSARVASSSKPKPVTKQNKQKQLDTFLEQLFKNTRGGNDNRGDFSIFY